MPTNLQPPRNRPRATNDPHPPASQPTDTIITRTTRRPTYLQHSIITPPTNQPQPPSIHHPGPLTTSTISPAHTTHRRPPTTNLSKATEPTTTWQSTYQLSAPSPIYQQRTTQPTTTQHQSYSTYYHHGNHRRLTIPPIPSI